MFLLTGIRYSVAAKNEPRAVAGELIGKDMDLLCCQDVLLSGKVVASCCFLFPYPKGLFCILTPSLSWLAGAGWGGGPAAATSPELLSPGLGLAGLLAGPDRSGQGRSMCSPSGRECSAREEGPPPAPERCSYTCWGAEVSLNLVGMHAQRTRGLFLRGNYFRPFFRKNTAESTRHCA